MTLNPFKVCFRGYIVRQSLSDFLQDGLNEIFVRDGFALTGHPVILFPTKIPL